MLQQGHFSWLFDVSARKKQKQSSLSLLLHLNNVSASASLRDSFHLSACVYWSSASW